MHDGAKKSSPDSIEIIQDPNEETDNSDQEIKIEIKKTFSCDWCDKSFTQSRSLKSHVKNVHDGAKNHSSDSMIRIRNSDSNDETDNSDQDVKIDHMEESETENFTNPTKNHSSDSMIRIRNSKSDSNDETDNSDQDVKIDHMEESETENFTNPTKRNRESDFEDSSSEEENIPIIKDSQNSSEWITIHELKVRYFQKNSSNHLFG